MQQVNERLLSAWLMMIMAVDSERIVSKLPYNEAIVCNILYNNADVEMTATDLCAITKMQKSLMNRTLTSLESKGLIERIRSVEDKRLIVIRLLDDKDGLFMTQHKESIQYVEKIASCLSAEDVDEVIRIFNQIAQIAQKENK